jgi:hypothetical protein
MIFSSRVCRRKTANECPRRHPTPREPSSDGKFARGSEHIRCNHVGEEKVTLSCTKNDRKRHKSPSLIT